MNSPAAQRPHQAVAEPVSDSPPAPGTPTRPWLRRLLMAGAVAVLLVVFMAYLSPHLAVDLANRLWACF